MFGSRLIATAIALGTLGGAGLAANANPTVSFNETFADDPVAGGRAAVTGDPAQIGFSPGRTDLQVDSESSNAQVRWDLPQPITDEWSFTLRGSFTIAPGYTADPNGFSQLVSFGLLNSTTTGGNRSSGPAFDDPATTYDLVSVDYFANVSPFFSTLTLTPTVFGSPTPEATGAFDVISAPFGSESLIDDVAGGEIGPLSASTTYEAVLTFDAVTRQLTLQLLRDGVAQNINASGFGGSTFDPDADAFVEIVTPGGLDGDVTTIQHTVVEGIGFSVDQIALFSWRDFFDAAAWTTPGEPSAFGTVGYSALSLEAERTVPEPAGALLLLAVGLAVGLGRRRSFRSMR